MAKERNYNPAQAQHKADKAKAIKKGKADQQARRNEKLAQRNPARLQKQIDDLKALKDGGGKLTPVEEQALEALEKDLKAVNKAREALGDRAPTFSRGGGGPGPDGRGVLGKRRRDDDDDSDDGDVPEDVRRIPMPRDTPPPIPKDVLDQWWARRRARRGQRQQARQDRDGQQRGSNANSEPLGEGRGSRIQGHEGAAEQLPERQRPAQPPPPPPVEAKTIYEAKPVIRDLRKEASAFVPAAVRMRVEKSKGNDQGDPTGPAGADTLGSNDLGGVGVGGAESAAAVAGLDPGSRPGPLQATVDEAEEDE